VATRLIQSVGALATFAYLGIAYFIVAIIAALFMQNPPEGGSRKDGRRLPSKPPSVPLTITSYPKC